MYVLITRYITLWPTVYVLIIIVARMGCIGASKHFSNVLTCKQKYDAFGILEPTTNKVATMVCESNRKRNVGCCESAKNIVVAIDRIVGVFAAAS